MGCGAHIIAAVAFVTVCYAYGRVTRKQFIPTHTRAGTHFSKITVHHMSALRRDILLSVHFVVGA